jgi:small subunit ribosomal protein S16
MVTIRLRRQGAKKSPFYRIVVADSRNARDGAFVEILGHYNPRTTPESVVIDHDRLAHWLSVGARPSDTVRSLVKRHPKAAEPAAEAAAV